MLKRQKWNETSPNSQVGDVVLIRGETCPRYQWPLANVTEDLHLSLFMLVRCNFIKYYNIWGSHITPSQL